MDKEEKEILFGALNQGIQEVTGMIFNLIPWFSLATEHFLNFRKVYGDEKWYKAAKYLNRYAKHTLYLRRIGALKKAS